jgi:hypothetical protein
MPDYELNVPDVLKMTLYGTFVDPAYSRLLLQKTALPIEDILALDRVQKQLVPVMLFFCWHWFGIELDYLIDNDPGYRHEAIKVRGTDYDVEGGGKLLIHQIADPKPL